MCSRKRGCCCSCLLCLRETKKTRREMRSVASAAMLRFQHGMTGRRKRREILEACSEGVLSAAAAEVPIPNSFVCEDTPCEVVLFAKGVCLPSAVVICFLSPRPRGEPRGSNESNFLFVCASTDPVAPVAPVTPVVPFNEEAVDEAPAASFTAASLEEWLLLLPSSSNPVSAHVFDKGL